MTRRTSRMTPSGPAATGSSHLRRLAAALVALALLFRFAGPEASPLLEKVDIVENVPAIFESWRHGTVIRSWLLDLLTEAIEDDEHLEALRGYADDSGEGRWTVQAAIDNAVPMHVIASSLFARFTSRQTDSPAMKAIAAMRNQFGGHAVHTEPPPGGEANPDA